MKSNKYKIIIYTFLLYPNLCFSNVTGKCIDSIGSPIPYINVGVKMSSVGTVSDENGIFHFEDSQLKETDSLIITHIGYVTQTITSNKKDTIIIILIPSQYQLNEIKIIASKSIFKNEIMVGNKVTTDHVVIGFTSHQLGTEIGKLINVKKGRKYKVENVLFNISHFDFKKATLRINFYNVDEERNAETARVNVNDFIKEVYNNESVEINVANEGLIFENDFLVSVEWIDFIHKDSMEIKKDYNLFINSSVFSGPYFRRSNNSMKWRNNKVKYNLGLGIQLLVKY